MPLQSDKSWPAVGAKKFLRDPPMLIAVRFVPLARRRLLEEFFRRRWCLQRISLLTLLYDKKESQKVPF